MKEQANKETRRQGLITSYQREAIRKSRTSGVRRKHRV